MRLRLLCRICRSHQNLGWITFQRLNISAHKRKYWNEKPTHNVKNEDILSDELSQKTFHSNVDREKPYTVLGRIWCGAVRRREIGRDEKRPRKKRLCLRVFHSRLGIAFYSRLLLLFLVEDNLRWKNKRKIK